MSGEISLDGVFAALHVQPLKSAGPGRCVMFVSASKGDGVTTISRAAAVAAGSEGTAYAIDLELRRNALAKSFKDAGEGLGPRINGRLNGVSFYRVTNALGQVVHEDETAFSYHRVARSRLYVGVFDHRRLPDAARVQISSSAEYWNAARAGGAVTIVDAPALERSQIALRVCAHMDGVVLVVGDDAGAAPAALAARTALLAAGANLMGLVYTKASPPVLAMDRLLRRAS
ncbi:hypothetical protein U91I_02658 [alpha proteobacterium U9-1i]|nr:hypothetical protein U91I_02658 [alpha proteobacterium U9-1i]